MLASVVISTYNRADALPATLDALARQDVPPTDYEVIVVDDGSSDGTGEVLAGQSTPYRLRTFRISPNRGVSAGRNVGIRAADGGYIILLSDDLLVPQNFISRHVAMLERFPGRWVVGGFSQLPDLAARPFGRYLDALERGFEQDRLGPAIGDGVYEMTVPTARNLSIPRASLEQVGLFDESFRVTCEDQDLAHRASQHGVRFLYDAGLECIHNDYRTDFRGYSRSQRLGARDTARLCDKYPEIHARGAVARANAYVLRGDGAVLKARKLVKSCLSSEPLLGLFGAMVLACERLGLPDRLLHPAYRLVVGLNYFRGFREGLAGVGGRRSRIVAALERRTG